MKLFGTGVALACMAACASALQNFQSADYQLNITSPLIQGQYVAGQMLPLIYTPVGNPLNLLLNVYLESVGGINPELPVALNADVSANDVNSVPVVVDGVEYRQHSINYPIPQTTPAGSYNVVFQNTLTQTNTSIPVNINAYVSNSTDNTTAPVATAVVSTTSVATVSATSINLGQPSASA